MTLTYEEAFDEMATIFKTAIDTALSGEQYFIYWEQLHNTRNEDDGPFFIFQIRHTGGRQASLAGSTGSNRFRRVGFIGVQIFSRTTNGLSESQQLAKVVADAYEGKTTPGGVWFRNVRMNEIGRDGQFYQTNVIVDFEYDEIK